MLSKREVFPTSRFFLYQKSMLWTKPSLFNPADYSPYQTAQQLIQPSPAEWERAKNYPKIAVLFSPADEFIAQEWYQLSANFPYQQVANLGGVQGGGESWAETIAELKKKDIFTIIIHSQPLAVHFWLATQQNIAVIDSHLQLKNPIFAQNLNIKTWLAHQSYYNDPAALDVLEKQGTNLLRLGQLKAEITAVEPLLRTANCLIINPRAVRAADMPLLAQPNPNGLAAAEICRLLRYAAINEHLQTAIIHNFEYPAQPAQQTAHLLAQMIWFLIEGFFARKGDYPLDLDKLQRYSVSVQHWNEPLHFFKSPRSERWWVAVPALMNEAAPTACLLPCGYKDYKKASKGELTERILDYLGR